MFNSSQVRLIPDFLINESEKPVNYSRKIQVDSYNAEKFSYKYLSIDLHRATSQFLNNLAYLTIN